MRMKITVEIENADGTTEIRPIVMDTGIPEFEEFQGPDNFREVFNNYEQAVLKIRNKAVNLATEEYLTEISKKLHTGIEGREGVTVKEEKSGYQIQAEIGYLDIVSHRAEEGSRTVYITKLEVFPKIGPREIFHSSCFEWLLCKYVSERN